MARRLRVFHSPIALGPVTLRGSAFAYAAVVHRARVGQLVELFDGHGTAGRGNFTGFEADALHIEVTEVVVANDDLRDVRLIQCLGKGDKIDDVLRDACELGVKEFVVADAARSVRKLDAAAGAKLRARLHRIAADTARQALTPRVANVTGPLPLLDVFAQAPEPLRLILHPLAPLPFFEALASAAQGTAIALAIGPEGGFTTAEIAGAEAHAWLPVRLGSSVLRTETMGAAALGALRAFDDT